MTLVVADWLPASSATARTFLLAVMWLTRAATSLARLRSLSARVTASTCDCRAISNAAAEPIMPEPMTRSFMESASRFQSFVMQVSEFQGFKVSELQFRVSKCPKIGKFRDRRCTFQITEWNPIDRRPYVTGRCSRLTREVWCQGSGVGCQVSGSGVPCHVWSTETLQAFTQRSHEITCRSDSCPFARGSTGV